jgi:Tfp pilus assembly protein PilV
MMIKRVGTLLEDESGFGLVETLIALTILVIGLVAVSGLSLASADQARIANWRSQQTAAAQMILEEVHNEGWDAAASHTDTATVSGHEYAVKVDVSRISTRVKEVTIAVAGVGDIDSRTFTTRMYKPRPLPDPPPGP